VNLWDNRYLLFKAEQRMTELRLAKWDTL
jgi:hypothetical protein